MKHLNRIILASVAVLLCVACEKEKETPTGTDDTVPQEEEAFALVLNEGNMSGNNASVSRLNTATGAIDNQWFEAANRRGLGDQAQDMIAYGSKVYITVTESNSLEILNPATGASQRVDMGDRKPRSMAADGGKIYITCYNPCSVVRVDTASLDIEATQEPRCRPTPLCRAPRRTCSDSTSRNSTTLILNDQRSISLTPSSVILNDSLLHPTRPTTLS